MPSFFLSVLCRCPLPYCCTQRPIEPHQLIRCDHVWPDVTGVTRCGMCDQMWHVCPGMTRCDQVWLVVMCDQMWPCLPICYWMWQVWTDVTRCHQMLPAVIGVASCDQMWPVWTGVTRRDQLWQYVARCDQMWPKAAQIANNLCCLPLGWLSDSHFLSPRVPGKRGVRNSRTGLLKLGKNDLDQRWRSCLPYLIWDQNFPRSCSWSRSKNFSIKDHQHWSRSKNSYKR